MIDIFQGILMAFFQGIIEWLPISSEGQLSLIFVNIFNMNELEALTLAFILHLGTMFSVLWCFRKDFLRIVDFKTPMTQLIAVATLGTAFTAIPIILFIKNYWETWTQQINIDPGIVFTFFIGLFLIITGLVLSKQPKQGIRELNSLSQNELIKIGFIVGLAQGIAALPGISRSGITITILLFFGFTQHETLRISFIMSVPAVLGAIFLELILEGFKINNSVIQVGSIEFPILILLFTIILTTIIGIITMNGLLRLKNLPYAKFCIGLGTVTILIAIIMIILNLLIL